jgi:hypothetical protein
MLRTGPRDLARLRRADLAALFASLAPPTAPLAGPYRGRLLSIAGLDGLPDPLRIAVHRLANSPLSPWSGKTFAGEGGANLWFGLHRNLCYGHFRVGAGPALDGVGAVQRFDYDTPENPRLLRPIVGEARELAPRRLLARMQYRRRSSFYTLLYFTLEN